MRIIQHGGSNLIITKHASPETLIHRGSTGREVTVTKRGQAVKLQRRGKRELSQKQKKERKKKQLTDTGEWNEGVKEKGISPCSSAETENDRARCSVSRRERATQAKCLKWITVSQTSEEDKTANMSQCSLLAFNNRCLISPSHLIVPHPGWSDLGNEYFIYFFSFLNLYS